jgi:nitrogen fixation protein FixH
MKINWGTGIVIAFIAFMSFIMYFVITMSTDNAYDHDLVVEEYYKQELQFDKNITKIEHSKTLTTNVNLKQTEDGILITFPKDLETQKIKGKVFLYRPSNKQLDFDIPIKLSNHNLLIPDNRLLDGRWNITVDWSYNNDEYMYKTELKY